MAHKAHNPHYPILYRKGHSLLKSSGDSCQLCGLISRCLSCPGFLVELLED